MEQKMPGLTRVAAEPPLLPGDPVAKDGGPLNLFVRQGIASDLQKFDIVWLNISTWIDIENSISPRSKVKRYIEVWVNQVMIAQRWRNYGPEMMNALTNIFTAEAVALPNPRCSGAAASTG